MFPFEQRLSEKEKNDLKANYKTLKEGYAVLYLEAEFKKLGYTVSRNREETMIELKDGKYKIFDLRLRFSDTTNPILVDLDMGESSSADYYAKLDKMYEASPDIHIATLDESTLYRSTKLNCFKWMADRFGGIDNAKGKVSFHFTTLEWLILGEKIWELAEI